MLKNNLIHVHQFIRREYVFDKHLRFGEIVVLTTIVVFGVIRPWGNMDYHRILSENLYFSATLNVCCYISFIVLSFALARFVLRYNLKFGVIWTTHCVCLS